MSRHSRWIKAASKVAKKSDFPMYRMGAICVKGGRVIGTAVNKRGGAVLKHPAYDKKSIHAELDLVLQFSREELRGSTIYVGGLTKANKYCKSKPCESCQQVLKEYGVKTAVWHTESGEVEMMRIS